MRSHVAGIEVLMNYGGDQFFSKYGFVNWVGLPVRVFHQGYTFDFDLSGRIHRMSGNDQGNWYNSWDWLQRTMCNDWLYYSMYTTGMDETESLIGDYYWPLNGRTDLLGLNGSSYLNSHLVTRAFEAFDRLIGVMRSAIGKDSPVSVKERGDVEEADVAAITKGFLKLAAPKGSKWLAEDAQRLHAILGNDMPVLPPDTIKVDYQVVPLMVMDGCGANCRMCDVRGAKEFAVRDQKDIRRQIRTIKQFYGEDLYNFNSVVLGQHNALAAGEDIIMRTAEAAYGAFGTRQSYHKSPSTLFMFSTVSAFLKQPDSFFQSLEALPFEMVRINVGWEAITDRNLRAFGKPQNSAQVVESIERAQKLYAGGGKIRVSGNLVLGNAMDDEHITSIVSALSSTGYKGDIYLSPLHGQANWESVHRDMAALREALPRGPRFYLYTMQRL